MFYKIKFVLIYAFLKIGFRHCCYCTWRVKLSRDISEICLTFFPKRRPTVPSLDSPLVWITETPSLTVRLSHGVIYIKKVFFKKKRKQTGSVCQFCGTPSFFAARKLLHRFSGSFVKPFAWFQPFPMLGMWQISVKKWRFYVHYIYLN